MSLKLSVIIPAYNEEANLKKGVLDQVEQYLKTQAYSYEVLIVDDGSIDQTAVVIEEQIKNKKDFHLIKNPHGGKAITVMTGLLKAQGEVAIFTDMDQATPISEIEKFLPQFTEGYDIVIGSRQGRRGAPLIRKIYAWGFTMLRNIVLGLPFSDTQCGFKAFNKEAVKDIFPQLLERWQKMKSGGAAVNAGFDVEMLFISKKRGYRITEVPVEWHYVGSERVKLSSAIEALKDIFRIRFNDLSGRYPEMIG